jgi:hypothetical protein
MDRIEERVRVLERRVRRYRILNLIVAGLLLTWAGSVFWRLLHLQEPIINVSDPAGVVRARRIEVLDRANTRPVFTVGVDDGGGRLEVFDVNGVASVGLDGNAGLVVRRDEAATFPR